MNEWILHLQWIFLFYFIGVNSGYLLLNILSIMVLPNYMQSQEEEGLSDSHNGQEIPISFLVPAYNEEHNIGQTVLSLLQLSYSRFEIIVINDGSSDTTLQKLIDQFDFKVFPESYRRRLQTTQIHAVYQSTRHHNLRLVDKLNGGKADALNAGLNVARYPLICSMDADSILQRNSLQKVVRPFMEDPDTIASSGTVRIANGCDVKEGFVLKTGLPSNPVALIQVMEYLRAFLFGRLGWAPLNAILIIPGTFGLFRKEAVISVGGYRHNTIGEDMELVVRLHRIFRQRRKRYRIHFVPNPICWTEAPEDYRSLRNQRVRWQQGLCESMASNKSLFLNPRAGAVGMFAYPFMAVFEWFGPLIEALGYLFVVAGIVSNTLSYSAIVAFFFVSIMFGLLLSLSALLLEEMSFHVYSKPSDVLKLMFAAIMENFGYRQINAFWRVTGFFRWISGKRGKWGAMKRKKKLADEFTRPPA